jgi:hypothetical protein
MKVFRNIIVVSFVLFLPYVTHAQFNQGTNSQFNQGTNAQFNQGTNSLVGFNNPLNANTICDALKLFLQALLTLAIPVAVLFLVYAGFLFVWARGKPAGLVHARRNLFFTILGIAIFMGAWLLGQVVANTFNALARGAGQPNNQIGQCK